MCCVLFGDGLSGSALLRKGRNYWLWFCMILPEWLYYYWLWFCVILSRWLWWRTSICFCSLC